MLIIENKYWCLLAQEVSEGLQFLPRKFAMTTPVSARLLIAGAPKRSTPYFAVSQQQIEVRERSPKRFVESERIGHGIEEQRFCEHYAPMMGFVRGRFGPSTIEMKISNCYKEADLDKWTNAAKCKILEACRSELAVGPFLNAIQLFEEPNLVLSWLDSKHLDNVHKLVPKVNIIFLFRPKDDFGYEWERWARERNVFLVLHDLEPDSAQTNSSMALDEQGLMRRTFADACTDTINSLNTFLKFEECCPVCKEKRTIHAVFACDGTSKSVGALLANIMFLVVVMQRQLCLIFWKSQGLGNLCLLLITPMY